METLNVVFQIDKLDPSEAEAVAKLTAAVAKLTDLYGTLGELKQHEVQGAVSTVARMASKDLVDFGEALLQIYELFSEADSYQKGYAIGAKVAATEDPKDDVVDVEDDRVVQGYNDGFAETCRILFKDPKAVILALDMKTDALVTVKVAAEILGITPRSVHQLVYKGKLVVAGRGARMMAFVTKESVDKYNAERRWRKV